MRARLLVPLLLAVAPLAGCGGGSGAAAPPVAPERFVQLKNPPAPVISEKRLIRRAERFCRVWHPHIGALPQYDAADPLASIRRANAYSRRAVLALRRGYRRFHALGIPRDGVARKRWIGLLSQFRATIDHLDELQAGNRVLDVAFARDSLRRLKKASGKLTRRGRKLGLQACVK